MKQRLTYILGIILVLIVLIILISSRGTASAINPNSQRIAELSYELSELESHKNICLDNLPYRESVENANGIHTYCELYDERIMAVQAEIEKLKEWRPVETGAVEWEPGMVSGDQQVMPTVVADTSHERFKEMCSAYGLDASTIWKVENHYGIKEGVILCITVAETSGGKRGAGGKNIGSVGSNDRGDRPTYALMEAGLEAIGKTLNNKYLGQIQTLGCLSNAGSCPEWDNHKHRYATSTHNREANMVGCLSKIYGRVDAKIFNIRR